ncbi:hypothetical protein ACFL35_20105 [Candidatus Riflebacteria bacterium]
MGNNSTFELQEICRKHERVKVYPPDPDEPKPNLKPERNRILDLICIDCYNEKSNKSKG